LASFLLNNAPEATGIAGDRRSSGRIGSGSESPATTTRPNLAGRRTSHAEWNRSRTPNPRTFPQLQNPLRSENRSWDIAEEALRTGAGGYVVKSDAASELLPAVEAVLKGKRFVSASLAGNDLTDPKDEHTADHNSGGVVLPFPAQNVRIARRHEAGFYSDDRFVLDDLTQFIGAALKAENATIVVATESHRDSLLPRLHAEGLDIGAAIEQGRYIALDAADALPTFMFSGLPDPVRFTKVLGDLIATAAKAAKREQARVAIFGEMCHLLWAQGNAEAAIQVEKLGNQLVKTYDVDILCGYSLSSVRGGMNSHIFQRICAEHSAVHSL
jgi:hypothetical protein